MPCDQPCQAQHFKTTPCSQFNYHPFIFTFSGFYQEALNVIEMLRRVPWACNKPWLAQCGRIHVATSRRQLVTLAIETSCDDTCVAVLEHGRKHAAGSKSDSDAGNGPTTLHFHKKVTSNNLPYQGVHPIAALESHQENLALLVREALQGAPFDSGGTIDFVTATRGPGMRSSLSVGLDTAKGLAISRGVPLVAVNHMQAHALTPRLVSALQNDGQPPTPRFPFLSLLVSGGHTMLIHSKSLCEHPILAETTDIAIGDCLDKAARDILPPEIQLASSNVMYGPLLERYAFPHGPDSWAAYRPPTTRAAQLRRKSAPGYPWSFAPPLAETRASGILYSFCGLGATVQRIVRERAAALSDAERRALAAVLHEVAFEHLASRVVLALAQRADAVGTLVVSGGVAANAFLKHVYVHSLLPFPLPSPVPSSLTMHATDARADCAPTSTPTATRTSPSCSRRWRCAPTTRL